MQELSGRITALPLVSLPDPDEVHTRADFLAFMQHLRRSLDFALGEPTPAPWTDQRGPWSNWDNRYVYWEAMTAWIEDKPAAQLRTEPIGSVLLEPVEFDLEQRDDLRPFLAAVEEWAAATADEGTPGMWNLAANAMIAGAMYE